MRFSRLTVSAVLTALFAILGFAASPAPASPPRAAVSLEQQAHGTTNVKRDYYDRAPLRRRACLIRMARAQAERMARRQEIFHQNLATVQRRCGMGRVGENVASGYASGRDVVNAWMRSPVHRANILNRHYRLQGLGAVSRDGTWYVAQVFGSPA